MANNGAPPQFERSTHIIVIRLSAMGDVAMTVPVLASLREHYPNLRLTILTRSFFAPMFSHLKDVKVHEADIKGRHKGFLGLWKLFRELRKSKPDAIADLHNVLRSNILKGFFAFTPVQFEQINKGRADKKALTAVKNKVFRPLKTTHDRYAAVFEKLGFPITLNSPPFRLNKTLSDKTKALLGSGKQLRLGFAPFAAYPGKMYPLDLMRTVIDILDNTDRYKIILLGGTSEAAHLKELAGEFKNAISVVGQLNFEEELSLISNLDLMLSMDSGNAHLAAIFGTPTLTIWGVTHPYAGFYPFGQDPGNALLADRKQFPLIPTSVYGNKLPPGYQDAIATIAPENIVRKIEEMTSGIRP